MQNRCRGDLTRSSLIVLAQGKRGHRVGDTAGGSIALRQPLRLVSNSEREQDTKGIGKAILGVNHRAHNQRVCTPSGYLSNSYAVSQAQMIGYCLRQRCCSASLIWPSR